MAQLPSISSQVGADVVKTITNIKNIDLHSKRNRHVNSWHKLRMRGLQNPTLPLALLVINTDSPLCTRFEQIESDFPYNIRVKVNTLTAEGALRALTDFTLSNARRFFSSMVNPLAVKGFSLGHFALIKN